MTLTELTNYFQNIAEKNKAISEGAMLKRFFRMSIEEIIGGSRSDAHTTILVLENYEGGLNGQTKDNLFKSKHVAFMVLKKVESGNFDQQTEFMDACETIVMQVLSKINKDWMGNRQVPAVPSKIKIFDFNSPKWSAVTNVLDGYYGWRCILKISDTENLTYNSLEWLP